MRVTLSTHDASRGPRPPPGIPIFLPVEPTYYLFIRTVPGWSATWRNRLREFAEPAFLAQAPSELCFHSFRFGLSLRLFLSPPLSLSLLLSLSFFLFLFRLALLCLLSFFSPLFAFHALPSSFFKLIHPLSSFLPFTSPPRMHLKALWFYRVDPSPSPTYPCPSAYYVIRITIICSETVSTAHQSEWQPVTRGYA